MKKIKMERKKKLGAAHCAEQSSIEPTACSSKSTSINLFHLCLSISLSHSVSCFIQFFYFSSISFRINLNKVLNSDCPNRCVRDSIYLPFFFLSLRLLLLFVEWIVFFSASLVFHDWECAKVQFSFVCGANILFSCWRNGKKTKKMKQNGDYQ